jgi:hypothetical protein
MIEVATADVDRDGFQLVENVLDEDAQRELAEALGPADGAGRRALLAMPAVVALARSERLLSLVLPHLGLAARPVQAIFFDKSPDANWLVPWHQDLTIAVQMRVEAAGFGPWSVKEGVPHVQPPVELLARMLTVRLHLDDADEGNGALRVLAGSHRCGRLGAKEIAEWRKRGTEVICSAAAGDAFLMRPLLLHASSKSTSSRSRRVLHLEYAGFELAAGMEWHSASDKFWCSPRTACENYRLLTARRPPLRA